MNRYEEVFMAIQEKVNNAELTYEEGCELNDMAYEKYTTEALSKTAIDNTEKAINGTKKIFKNAGAGYNKIMDKTGESIAKMVIKKPQAVNELENSHVMNDYVNKLNTVKTAFKVGATATLLALPGTLAWMTPLTIAAFSTSNNPKEKAVADKARSTIQPLIDKLKGKWAEMKKAVADANNSKEVTPEAKATFDKAYMDGLNISKQIDTIAKKEANAIKSKLNTDTATSTTESTDLPFGVEDLQEMLFGEDGNFADDAAEIIESFIINTDYDDDTYDIIESVIELIF